MKGYGTLSVQIETGRGSTRMSGTDRSGTAGQTKAA